MSDPYTITEGHYPHDSGRAFAVRGPVLAVPMLFTTMPNAEAVRRALNAADAHATAAAEKRAEVLEKVLNEVADALAFHADDEADPEDTRPEDMFAHINGLCRQSIEAAIAAYRSKP